MVPTPVTLIVTAVADPDAIMAATSPTANIGAVGLAGEPVADLGTRYRTPLPAFEKTMSPKPTSALFDPKLMV